MADFEDKFVSERGFYQPSSDETWEAYQALVTVVESQAKVHLSREVLCGVADEVLWVLKSKNIPSPSNKKSEIEKILSPIPYFIYNQLASTAHLITDYHGSGVGAEKDFYQPKSVKTWIPYKSLLDLINDQFGFEQPHVVQCTLAHEVLVTLKDESIDTSKKRDMIANTLEPISDHTFDALLSIGKRITDFNDEAAAVEYMNVDPGPQYDFEFADDVFCDPDDDDDLVLDPNSDSDVSELADNDVQSSSRKVADNDLQSSSSDDELHNLGFEKIRRGGDKEDTEDWVVV